MAIRELNIEEIDRKFDELLNSLSREEVMNWLEKDRENQLTELLCGGTISITSPSMNEVKVYIQFESVGLKADNTSYALAA